MTNRMIHTPSYLAAADFTKYWTQQTSMHLVSGWYSRQTGGAYLQKTLDSQSGWTVGFRFKYEATPAAAILVQLQDSGTVHCDLRFNGTTGCFYVTRAGTTLLTSTTALNQSTEYYIEIKFVVADTGTAIMYIDGVVDSVINSTSVDTRNGANASANILQLFGTNTGTLYMKDIYVNDNAGGVDDTFWGPIAVATLTPSSAGNKAEWTPSASTNVSNVDDTTPDDDTTYNATDVNAEIDSFVMTNTGYASGTVKGVEVVLDVRRTDASSTARVAPLWRISSTDYPGTDMVPTTTYLLQSQRYRQSPATASAWTVSELDGAECGYKRTAA